MPFFKNWYIALWDGSLVSVCSVMLWGWYACCLWIHLATIWIFGGRCRNQQWHLHYLYTYSHFSCVACHNWLCKFCFTMLLCIITQRSYNIRIRRRSQHHGLQSKFTQDEPFLSHSDLVRAISYIMFSSMIFFCYCFTPCSFRHIIGLACSNYDNLILLKQHSHWSPFNIRGAWQSIPPTHSLFELCLTSSEWTFSSYERSNMSLKCNAIILLIHVTVNYRDMLYEHSDI